MLTPCLIILIVVALVLLVSLLLYSNSRKKAKEKLATKKYAKDWLSAIAERKPVKSNVGLGSINKSDIVSIPLSPNDLYKTELVPCTNQVRHKGSEIPIRGRKAYVDDNSSRSNAWNLATGWDMANSPHSSDRDISQTPSSHSKPSRCNEPSYDTSSNSCSGSGSSYDSGSSDSGSSSYD